MSAAAQAEAVASDAAASPPPATAAAWTARDPRPLRPASVATDAVNRTRAAAEIAWPAALKRAGPALLPKYCRTLAGSAPGRG